MVRVRKLCPNCDADLLSTDILDWFCSSCGQGFNKVKVVNSDGGKTREVNTGNFTKVLPSHRQTAKDPFSLPKYKSKYSHSLSDWYVRNMKMFSEVLNERR